MKTNIVRVGNSRGIRIPKTLLDQCCLGETVELEVKKDLLIVRPARRPRAGWDEAFREMAERSEDSLPDWEPPTPTQAVHVRSPS